MSEDPPEPSKRYIELVLALKDHLGGVRGWQARVAAALDAHPTYISKIARGERLSVGIDSIERAIALGVPREAFARTAPTITPQFLESLLHLTDLRSTSSKLARKVQSAFWTKAARSVATIATTPPEMQATAFRDLAHLIDQESPEITFARRVLAEIDDERSVEVGRTLAQMVLRLGDLVRSDPEVS